MTEQKLLLSRPEAAGLLRTHYTLRECFGLGLPFVQLGKSIWVDRRDIDEFINRHKVTQGEALDSHQ